MEIKNRRGPSPTQELSQVADGEPFFMEGEMHVASGRNEGMYRGCLRLRDGKFSHWSITKQVVPVKAHVVIEEG